MSFLVSLQDIYDVPSMKTDIGDRIKKARENKDIDQATLARKVHIATRTLQRWEKGEQVPAGDYLMQIARWTGVRPGWVLTGICTCGPIRPPISSD